MKRLLLIPLLLFSVIVYGQYALPTTQVYGNLTVDSVLINTNPLTDFTITNDSLDIVAGKFPFAGLAKSPYGSGYSINGQIDLSLAGGTSHTIIAGFASFPTVTPSRQTLYKSDSTKARILTELGDTTSALTLFAGFSGDSIGFDLETSFCKTCPNVGFETQFEVSGLLTAKTYATNYDGTTNLSVIEVDTAAIRIKTNDSDIITKYNENGVVFPNLKGEPTGENGAIYYNTTLRVFRAYENGAWRNL